MQQTPGIRQADPARQGTADNPIDSGDLLDAPRQSDPVPIPTQQPQQVMQPSRGPHWLLLGIILLLLSGTGLAVRGLHSETPSPVSMAATTTADNYLQTNPPSSIQSLVPAQTAPTTITTNGLVTIAGGLVIEPSTIGQLQPIVGELLYDKATNQLYYYNGTTYVSAQGSVGPQGHAGANGHDGVQGPQGSMGPPGPSGSSADAILNQTISPQTAGFSINGSGTAGMFNATSSLELHGADINTSGTLSNVAYLSQANTFTSSNLFKDASNSPTAFQVQNASASTILDVDATSGYVGIGTNTPSAKLNIADVGFSDAFNRANNTSLGSNWTKVTDAGSEFRIVSNQVNMTSSDNSSDALGAYTTQGITSANYAVQSDIVFPSSSDDWLGVMGRANLSGGSDTNGYYLFASIGNQKVAIYKRVSGTWTQLGSSSLESISASTTYTLKLIMNGTTLSGYWNGTLIISTSDSTFSSAGFAGVAVGYPNLSGSVWDNFSVTSVNPSLNVNNTFAVTANGWVGIGTMSPNYALDVQGGGNINTAGSYLLNGASINTAGTLSNVAYLNQANIFKDGTNSTAAFQVQNSTGSNLLTVDTSNTAIVLGNDGAPSTLTVRGGAATGNDVQGSNITFDASNGTGTGGSGDLIFRTADGAKVNFDASASGILNGYAANVFSWSHTTASQSNRLLIVNVGSEFGDNATSITYDGVSLTHLSDSGTDPRAEIWYLINPPVGTYTVQVTLLNDDPAAGVSSTFYNVSQTAPFGTPNTNTTSGGYTTSISTSVSTSNASQVVFDAVDSFSNPITPNAGQTLNGTVANNEGLVAASTRQLGTGASVSTGWSAAPNTDKWGIVAVPINPVGGISPDVLTDRLHITSTGNIGIDNSNPQYTLDVSGMVRIQTSVNSTTAFQIQNASGTALFTADTTNMQVTVTTLAVSNVLTVSGHIVTGGTTPTVAAGSAACTIPTVSIAGDDTAGVLIVTTGSGCSSAGQLATITFSSAYAAAPQVLLSAANSAGSLLPIYATTTTTTFTISTPNTPTSATTYTFRYYTIQ